MERVAKLIVIVEDEADVAKYLSAALQDEGYEVLVASDAEQGTKLLRTLSPDLICLDLVMPGRTGLSLYRELRSAPGLKGVPIVVVSGVSQADAADGLPPGDEVPPPDAFVEKPVDLPRFLRTVGELLGA
jgi:CheY-like chemotaxis protein